MLFTFMGIGMTNITPVVPAASAISGFLILMWCAGEGAVGWRRGGTPGLGRGVGLERGVGARGAAWYGRLRQVG